MLDPDTTPVIDPATLGDRIRSAALTLHSHGANPSIENIRLAFPLADRPARRAISRERQPLIDAGTIPDPVRYRAKVRDEVKECDRTIQNERRVTKRPRIKLAGADTEPYRYLGPHWQEIEMAAKVRRRLRRMLKEVVAWRANEAVEASEASSQEIHEHVS